MTFKILGNFKRLIYSSNNFYIYVFKISANQQEQKEMLNIDNSNNYFNVISKTNDIDLTLDYEIELRKEIRPNSKYKINYFIESKEIKIMNERESIIRYLSSSIFKGISKKTAEKIVDNLGTDFLTNIDAKKSELIDLIGKNKATIIIENNYSTNELNELNQIFIKNNLSTNLLQWISFVKFKNIKSFLENSIYDLVEKDDFNDYVEFDKIAKFFYVNYNEDISNKFLILHETIKIEYGGSTKNSIESIYQKVIQYRNIDVKKFKQYIIDLANESKIIIHKNKIDITSNKMFKKEEFICDKINELLNLENNEHIIESNLITNQIDETQKKALMSCLSNSISIITGGPGTGKTLLIDLIMKNLRKMKKKKIELLAPTGKAATQISSKTFENARTFHSFLKWNERTFDVNEKNPSNVEIIIIDEFSMINIDLFFALLKGCPKLKKIIIVGDKDQLPSIGPGCLLNDFIESNKIIVNKLSKIYRQSEGSLIAKNSKLINQSQMPIFDDYESKFIDISIYSDNAIENKIIAEIEEYLQENKTLMDFQILIPMYNGNLGINKINSLVQNYINKNKKVFFFLDDRPYYLFDKVIQLENDNDKNIFNGEIGQIINVSLKNNETKSITIKFDNNREIEYTKSEFKKNVSLAYAISVHKFQGSECNEVLIILIYEHQIMFSKKLFYTSYTRARVKNVIVSTKNIIQKCINNDKDSNRKTNILELLK